MSDILLNPTTHDIALTGARMSLATGAAEVAQRVRLRLLLNRGEDPYDVSEGIPWIPDLATESDPAIVRQVIIRRLEGCDVVRTVDEVTVSDNPVTRARMVTVTVNGSVAVTL